MNKCRAKKYKTNIVIFHGAIVCWGFQNSPPCEYLKDCVDEHKDKFSKRKYNNISKKYFKSSPEK
jgi:hypothetical protein